LKYESYIYNMVFSMFMERIIYRTHLSIRRLLNQL
jgi:hypothetical protein